MRIIETQTEFEEMLTLDRCLVFVAADWSGSSVLTECKVRAWLDVYNARHDVSAIEVLKIDSYEDVFTKWLFASDADELQGIVSMQNGVLVLLQHGKAMGWLRSQQITEQSINEWVYRCVNL